MGLRARLLAAREIFWGHPWVRFALVFWALVCGYDQLSGFISQLVGRDLPTLGSILGVVFRVGVVNGSLLPWWGWILILQGVLFISLVEYVVRHVRNATPAGGLSAALTGRDFAPSNATYDGSHEKLMLFVSEHLLHAVNAMFEYERSVVGSVKFPNDILKKLASDGVAHRQAQTAMQEGLRPLEGLWERPPRFISQEEMEAYVAKVERYYASYWATVLQTAHKLAPQPDGTMPCPLTWDIWRDAHNAMIAAYEPIRKDSRLPGLFRPGMVGGLGLPMR